MQALNASRMQRQTVAARKPAAAARPTVAKPVLRTSVVGAAATRNAQPDFLDTLAKGLGLKPTGPVRVVEDDSYTVNMKTQQEAAKKQEIVALFNLWNDTLRTKDPKKQAALYGPEGVLLPTLSNVPRNTPESIADYFSAFQARGPQGVLDEYEVRYLNDSCAINSGVYTFTFADNGQVAQARFTYVYKKYDGVWKIAYHHSSLMPESFEAEIEGTFQKWVNAAKSGVPEAVAACYASAGMGVLLPTVSNCVRSNPEAITAYFVDFLAKGPTGCTVDIGFITPLGTNAACYTGTYTFTFKDGSVVPARFSFTYVKENGLWKIADHHSSMMPEKVAAPAA